MRQFLFVPVLYILSLHAVQAQNYNRDNFPTVINPDSLDNYLSMGCGKGGPLSVSFVYHRDLILNKDYSTIRKNLFSKVDVVKLLSTLTLQHLSDKKQISLTKDEKKQIALIKKSQNKIRVCIGCTYVEDQTLYSLFLENEVNRGSIDFNNWLKSELTDETNKN